MTDSIIVTGGAGYIGSHMVLALVEAGERVVVLDNLSTGFAWAVAKGVPMVVGDTGDQPLVARVLHRLDDDRVRRFSRLDAVRSQPLPHRRLCAVARVARARDPAAQRCAGAAHSGFTYADSASGYDCSSVGGAATFS